MEDQELIDHLVDLISKYIEDDDKKKELLDLVRKRGGTVAKGVLHEINNSKIPCDKNDSKRIKDIAFYYV